MRWIARVIALVMGFSIEMGCALIVDLGPERTRFIASDVTVNEDAPTTGDGGVGADADGGQLTDGAVGAVVQVAAGWNHACVLFESGRVSCWGGNDYGQLGRPPAATDPICEEKNGTKHVCQPTPSLVPNLTDVAKLGEAGTDFNCALKKDGTVWCWGRNQHGQIGVLDQECAVPAPGGVFGAPTRCNPNPQLVTLPGKAQALAGSAAGMCALLENGDVVCWAFNDGARAGIPLENPTATPFDSRKHPPTKVGFPPEAGPIARVSPSNSVNTTCAMAESGRVWCWGKASWGQRWRLPSSVGPAGCNNCSHVPSPILDPDGGALSDAIALTTSAVTCVRRNDKTIWCAGGNFSGELGLGTVDNLVDNNAHWVPTKVPNLPPIADLVGRFRQLFATDTAGDVWVWGENQYGTLGIGTIGGIACSGGAPDCVPVPVKNAALSGMIQISPAANTVVARKADNTVWVWGSNVQGQLGHPPNSGGDVVLSANGAACNPTPAKVIFP